jgi:2-C-methyl-D-erythritol 4-phosphate cytidylyltransferase
MKNYAIILAAGSGSRFKSVIPKQFIRISGKTITEHTIELFENIPEIDGIIVVSIKEYIEFIEEIVEKRHFSKVMNVIVGGNSRKESSYLGINCITDDEAKVVIHDAVRPFLTRRVVLDCLNALDKYDAVDVAIPSADTIIQIDNNKLIESIPQRDFMFRGQTPQCFKLSVIKKAHQLAINDELFTDDCGLVVKYDLGPVYVVDGDQRNIKITYLEDIFLADKLFQVNSVEPPNFINIKNLKDKVIVVFGGTSGIGKSIVDIAANYKALCFPFSRRSGCDVSDYSSVKSTLEYVFMRTNRIDYVINTAGILKIGKLSSRSINSIYEELQINYFGSINVVKASLNYLKTTKGAILLFTSSSYTRGRSQYSTYSSTKAALVNLTQAISEEVYDEGIRINAINPERTATPLRLKAFGSESKKTLCSPEFVAKASLKVLLSTVTGQVINVKRI